MDVRRKESDRLYWNGLKYHFMERIDMILYEKDFNYIFNNGVIFLNSFKSEVTFKINIFIRSFNSVFQI